jgi:uncharacterized protein YbjT (DUF2867 family)
MTSAVIGATGRVGSEVVHGILARGKVVAALVRDPHKAHRLVGEPCAPGPAHQARRTRLDDPRDLVQALQGSGRCSSGRVSIGVQGVLQPVALSTLRSRGSSTDAVDHPRIVGW